MIMDASLVEPGPSDAHASAATPGLDRAACSRSRCRRHTRDCRRDDQPRARPSLEQSSGGKPATGRGAWQSLEASPLGTRGGVNPAWTGDEVLVWGGNRGLLFLQDGAAYNPTTHSWRSIAPNQWAFPSTVSTWTGDHFVVLAKNSGATYDPATNTWQDLPSLPDQSNGSFVGITWTGHDLLGLVQSQGDAIFVARYNPTTSSWAVGPTEHATLPTDRARISVVWTGTELVTWNGTNRRLGLHAEDTPLAKASRNHLSQFRRD